MRAKRLVITVCFGLLLSGIAAPLPAAGQYRLGVLPYYAPEKIWHYYAPFIEYLNRSTGLSWELKLYSDYGSIVKGICAGEITVAYLGPKPFSLAHETCGVQPLLVVLGEDGSPFYRSIIFTNDKGITSLGALAGKKVAFGDRNSTSSSIVPKRMLEEEGITMDMITPVSFASHEKIVNAVMKGRVSAGATKDSIFHRMKETNLRALKVSGPLPHHTFCIRPGDSPGAVNKFAGALLSLAPSKSRQDRTMMKRWDPELRNGVVRPPDRYLAEVLNLHPTTKESPAP